MSGERAHRLVPFLSGAALAIILDTAVQLYRSRGEPREAEPAKAEAITAVPAQKVGVVSREPQPEPPTQPQAAEGPSPVQEARSIQRRSSAPMPNGKDIDAALTRALARRGLELADLDRLDELKPLVAKLRAARTGIDGRDVESALEKLLPEIARAPLTHDLLTTKLEQVRRVLTQAESAMEKERFLVLQQRYLDAKLELSALTPAQLGAFAVKLSELLKDIRAAKPTP